jgi:hemoglobin
MASREVHNAGAESIGAAREEVMIMRSFVVFGIVVVLTACSAQPREPSISAAPAGAAPSLYLQLGGQPAIEALVDALVAQYKSDPRIAARFDLPATDIAYLRARLIEQLCQATGGPCEYTGLSMPDAHSGLAITNAEFDAFMEDTNKAMTQLGVSDEHQLILGEVLGGMRGDVVEQ